jgi:hypothetical protein
MFLPLHAAGVYSGSQKESCSDYVVSSYTPTLSALLRAREEPIKLLPAQIQLLLVSEGRAKSKDLPVLVSVDRECEEIMQVAKSDCIPIIDHMIGDTTVSRVLQGLSSANIVHLACHGIQDTQDAVASGFCLGDGNLTLSDLMDTDLDHAFLAFLSACETAKGDEKQPDQTVHLAAAMLFAGFRSVIATMWCVQCTEHGESTKLTTGQGNERRRWASDCSARVREAILAGSHRRRCCTVCSRRCSGRATSARCTTRALGHFRPYGCLRNVYTSDRSRVNSKGTPVILMLIHRARELWWLCLRSPSSTERRK